MKGVVREFVDQREWQQFHDPKNLSMSIAIEAAELMEHFQGNRSEDLESIASDRKAMDEIREELADIVAYVVSFASTMKIDISSALEAKMKKNAIKYPVEQYKGRYKGRYK